MTHETEISFRGQARTVEFEHEGDGIIIWWFPDDTQNADKEGGAIEKERQDIYEVLWEWLLDFWQGSPEDDRC